MLIFGDPTTLLFVLEIYTQQSLYLSILEEFEPYIFGEKTNLSMFSRSGY